MGLFIFWIICGIAAGIIGGQKGAGCLGFIVGFLLGPVGIVIALVMKGERKICPHCRGYVDLHASKCPHCQESIAIFGSPIALDDHNTKKCPDCAETVKSEAIKCKHCGYSFPLESVKNIVEEQPISTPSALPKHILRRRNVGQWELDKETLKNLYDENKVFPMDEVYDPVLQTWGYAKYYNPHK